MQKNFETAVLSFIILVACNTTAVVSEMFLGFSMPAGRIGCVAYAQHSGTASLFFSDRSFALAKIYLLMLIVMKIAPPLKPI